jgi:hypothetical protein
MQKTKKKFLTTSSNFKEVRALGGVYVDKTKQIYNFLSSDDKYYFFARPRRFGKSTLCRTLEELFRGNRAVFKGLWIDTSDWGWKEHPIIYLDMTLAAGKASTIAAFRSAVNTMLERAAELYGVEIAPKETVAERFEALIATLYKKFNTGVAVIIDEYDKPILDLISSDQEYKLMHREMSDLYAVLKPADPYIRLAFLTGVFKFTQTSIFSNLNNLKDLTFDITAGDLVGYTQEEVERNFKDEIELLAAAEQLDYAGMLDKLSAEYNGYCFGFNVTTGQKAPHVYNPFAINNTFAENQMLKRWFASGSPSLLIKKIKEGKFEMIKPEGLLVDFSKLSTSCDPDKVTALSLLYYAGYATIAEYIKDYNKVRLVYPNIEVASATATQLVELFADPNDSFPIKDRAYDLAKAFRTNDMQALENLFEIAFSHITYQIFVSEEKYFQTMIMLILCMGNLRVEAEVATSMGRADLVVYTHDCIFIIETKFNDSASKGLAQIKDRGYMKKFVGGPLPVVGVGINVDLKKTRVKKKKLFTVAWEQLCGVSSSSLSE